MANTRRNCKKRELNSLKLTKMLSLRRRNLNAVKVSKSIIIVGAFEIFQASHVIKC